MYEWLIHFKKLLWLIEDFYFTVDSLSTGIFNQAEFLKREKPFERKAERDRRNKKVLSLFPAWKAHYSSNSPLSEKHPPSLNYLTFLDPASPPHKPTLCEWLVFLLRHRLRSYWPFHSLISLLLPPLFCPALSSFYFSFSSLLVAHTNQLPTKELSHWVLNQNFTSERKHYSRGTYCWSLKVQKLFLF